MLLVGVIYFNLLENVALELTFWSVRLLKGEVLEKLIYEFY